MEHVILVIHLLLALAIIGLVLIQRSEGGGLGIGGGGGGMGGFATAGQTASGLVRATRWVAAAFFCTSIILAILAGTHTGERSLFESLDNVAVTVDSEEQTSDNELPSAEAIGESSNPPSAPISE
jgi:preprotein translocase subunit SecG